MVCKLSTTEGKARPKSLATAVTNITKLSAQHLRALSICYVFLILVLYGCMRFTQPIIKHMCDSFR